MGKRTGQHLLVILSALLIHEAAWSQADTVLVRREAQLGHRRRIVRPA